MTPPTPVSLSSEADLDVPRDGRPDAMDAPAPVAAIEPPACLRSESSVPVLEVPADLPFEALRAWARETMPACLPHIGGRASRLDMGGREIQLFDLRRLIHVLRDEFQVEITGLYVRPEAIHRYAERELKLKLFATSATPPAAEPVVAVEPEAAIEDDKTEEHPIEPSSLDEIDLPHDLEPADVKLTPEPVPEAADLEELAVEAPRRTAPDSGARTLTVHRTLRSGAVVRFDGDVIVFGDVNPGANVIATGNVVVLGALKGMAHAGALGEEGATILAFDFRPTQVRIGRKIAMPPANHKSVPELVVVRNGDIVIEPYRGRFR